MQILKKNLIIWVQNYPTSVFSTVIRLAFVRISFFYHSSISSFLFTPVIYLFIPSPYLFLSTVFYFQLPDLLFSLLSVLPHLCNVLFSLFCSVFSFFPKTLASHFKPSIPLMLYSRIPVISFHILSSLTHSNYSCCPLSCLSLTPFFNHTHFFHYHLLLLFPCQFLTSSFIFTLSQTIVTISPPWTNKDTD